MKNRHLMFKPLPKTTLAESILRSPSFLKSAIGYAFYDKWWAEVVGLALKKTLPTRKERRAFKKSLYPVKAAAAS